MSVSVSARLPNGTGSHNDLWGRVVPADPSVEGLNWPGVGRDASEGSIWRSGMKQATGLPTASGTDVPSSTPSDAPRVATGDLPLFSAAGSGENGRQFCRQPHGVFAVRVDDLSDGHGGTLRQLPTRSQPFRDNGVVAVAALTGAVLAEGDIPAA